MPFESANHRELAISDLLDRALHKGIVICGEATISLAGVDLVHVGLQVLVASVDTVQKKQSVSPEEPELP
ncbi:gas vesicle protein [Flexibacterium corallicola]|uniref:gas vesicle protein n=1 Tax=Flexibacterium corallicola TaxID=3037259 RepID=UPI00286F22D6|nr:gas vesicle protein [Pseudovibrio sp. M1P-2-3]